MAATTTTGSGPCLHPDGAQCLGVLVVHLDGSAAACTEELWGRCCPGPQVPHLGAAVSCQDELGPGGCELCAMEAFDDRDWRHAAHVGQMARGRGRCRVGAERCRHGLPRMRPFSASPPARP